MKTLTLCITNSLFESFKKRLNNECVEFEIISNNEDEYNTTLKVKVLDADDADFVESIADDLNLSLRYIQ